MKAVIIFLVCMVAIAHSQDDECDPHNNGDPSPCPSAGKFRNYWDPTCFWNCAGAGAQATIVRCEEHDEGRISGFQASSGNCVEWPDWDWVPKCPDNNKK